MIWWFEVLPLMSTLTLSGARGDVWGGPSTGGGELLEFDLKKKKKIFILDTMQTKLMFLCLLCHSDWRSVFENGLFWFIASQILELCVIRYFEHFKDMWQEKSWIQLFLQGLQLATRGKLDVRGVVWDSCPGPRPEITIPRFLMVALVFNWNWVTNSDWWIKSKFHLSFIGLRLF